MTKNLPFFEIHLETKILEQVYGGQMSQDSGGIAIPGNLTEEVTLNGTTMTEDEEGKTKKLATKYFKMFKVINHYNHHAKCRIVSKIFFFPSPMWLEL